MRGSRLQNRIAESPLTLPVCAVATLLLWWWPQPSFNWERVAALVLCALTTYVILETSNANSLIRVRTRLVSCIWLVFAACAVYLRQQPLLLVPACCLALSHSQFFGSYQRTNATTAVFHSALFLSLGSVAWPPMMWLAPAFAIHQFVHMRSATPRHLLAAGVGLVLPYWLWAGWAVYADALPPLLAHLQAIATWPASSGEAFGHMATPMQLLWALATLLAAVGTVSYLRKPLDEVIRVRQILYLYSAQTAILWFATLLMPSAQPVLLPMLMVSCCPLAAHYFALSGTRLGTIFFVLSFLVAALAAVASVAL